MISKNLTSQLRLKHYPQSVRYDGVHGKGCSKAYGHTELKSLVDPDKLTVVTFSVIPQLKPVNPPRHKTILEDSAIKELKLADPDPGRTINLIIGNLGRSECVEGSIIRHPAEAHTHQDSLWLECSQTAGK